MTKITPEAVVWAPYPTKHKKAHLKKGCVCPFCGEETVEGEMVEINGPMATQECSCTSCHGMWIDEYDLKRVFFGVAPHEQR